MGHTSIDYKEAERRYVVEGKSVRQIAKDMGLHSWSSMNVIANREDWKGKRQAYLNSIARRSYETAAAVVANERNTIIDEAILAGRATLRKYLGELAAGNVHVTPRDAQAWAAFLMSEMVEHRDTRSEVPDVRNVTPADSDHLRRIVEAARGHVDSAGSVGPAPLVQPSGTRPN